jgi:hypothetical protein
LRKPTSSRLLGGLIYERAISDSYGGEVSRGGK